MPHSERARSRAPHPHIRIVRGNLAALQRQQSSLTQVLRRLLLKLRGLFTRLQRQRNDPNAAPCPPAPPV